MAFEQVRDVIERARAFHRELADFYHRAENDAERERVKLLLDYLVRHEQRMGAQLAAFEHDSSRRVMETWFVVSPGATIREEIARIKLRPDMTTSEVICMALRIDEFLLQLYREAAEEATNEAVRETFQRLFEEGKRERSKMVLDVFEPE